MKTFSPIYYYYLGVALVAVAMLVSVRWAVRSWLDASKLEGEEQGMAARLLNPLLQRVGPRSDIAIRQLKAQLQMAGMRDDAGVQRFTMMRFGSLFCAVLLIGVMKVMEVEAAQLVVFGGGLILLGIQFPVYVLRGRIAARQERIARALPSMIDLMVLCLDVGLSIESAFERVTFEIRTIEPLLGEEAAMMSGEISAGLTFSQALRRMADRIGLEELITLARLLGQANSLGASVATALREYSEASFTRRILGLEERAGKITAWMIMPVTICMLPAALLALGGPAVVVVVMAMGDN